MILKIFKSFFHFHPFIVWKKTINIEINLWKLLKHNQWSFSEGAKILSFAQLQGNISSCKWNIKELVHITHQAVELASIHCHVQIWNDIKALSFFNILQLPLQAFCCKSSAANNKHYTGRSKRMKCLSEHLADHLTLVENSRLSPGVKHFSPDEGPTINRILHMCFWYGTHAARK